MQTSRPKFDNIFLEWMDLEPQEIAELPQFDQQTQILKQNEEIVEKATEIKEIDTNSWPKVTTEKASPISPKLNTRLRRIQRKSTADVSDSINGISDSSSYKSEYNPSLCGSKRRKKRRDVTFKTILRECRRYFQNQISNLTGFISSKKARNDDYMYTCMKRFNLEILGTSGTFRQNFYLACLLYPQDLSRNLDRFLEHKEDNNMSEHRKTHKEIIQKIHDTLYKYSHEKFEYFASVPEISFLFCYYYENGAGPDKENPKFVEEYEYIRNKCMDSLNRTF